MPDTPSPTPNPRNLRKVREIARPGIHFGVARVPMTSRLLVAGSDGFVTELDAGRNDSPTRRLAEHGRYVNSVRLAGNVAVSGGYDNRLIWFDVEMNRAIRTVDAAHTRPIRQLAISPDGTKVASVADDMVCRLWNVATGQRLFELRGHEAQTPTHFTSMLYACAFSADGSKLATGDRVGHIVIWDTATGRSLTTLETPSLYTWDAVQRIRSIGGIRALAFSPDGTQLAVGGVGHIGNVDGLEGPARVEIVDIGRREKVHEFQGPNAIINKLIWHPRGTWLCALGGGNAGLVMFHDVAAKVMLHSGNFPMLVHDAVFDEGYATLYAVGHQKIAVYDLPASPREELLPPPVRVGG
jgi:WD40 repeat protein